MINYFNLPKSCKINHKVKIEDFFKHAPISLAQKVTIKANTLDFRISYNITPEKAEKTAVRLNTADFPEIQIISIKLYAYRYCKYEFRNFVWPFFRSIPYPLILIAEYNHHKMHYVRFASSTFHEGKFDASKNVQESIIASKWIDVNNCYDDDSDLLDNIAYTFGAYDDLHSIYSDWTAAFNSHALGFSGNYSINCQECIYRKKEIRDYYDQLEERRKQFKFERKNVSV